MHRRGKVWSTVLDETAKEKMQTRKQMQQKKTDGEEEMG